MSRNLAVKTKDTVSFVKLNNLRGTLVKTVLTDPTGTNIKVTRRTYAERQIKLKWDSLNGVPGPPKVPGPEGVIEIGEGFYREYLSGRIYWVLELGAFWVYGAIGQRYTELGGPGSWLGHPISDEDDFFDGRASKFQNGAIYWFPDTGPAIDLGEIVVRYAGLACFGETDEASASDEPYAIFAVVPMLGQQATPRTAIYEDVDAGDSREDNIELYRGLPYGLSVTAVLMEHDLADPNKYQETIKLAVDKASEGIAIGLRQIPYVGPFVAPVGEAFLKAVGPDITEFINDVLVGGADDHIGTVSFVITPKDMVRLTRVERDNFRGILWHLDSPLISDGEASYKVYVEIEAV